jgi:hypothetical protein
MAFVNCDHIDMPAEEYHASPGWSNSQLKHLPGEPELFHGLYIRKRPEWQKEQRESSVMRFGTAGHAWFLENEKPVVAPPSVLSKAGSRAGKAWESFEAAHDGDTILTQDEWDALQYAKTRAQADPEIDAYLATAGMVEHSLFATDEATGLPVRCRIDKIPEFHDGLEVLDLKFSGDVSEYWASNQMAKMLYYRQAAFYWDLATAMYQEPKAFTFLFVRNEPPYDSALWRLYADDIDLGRQENAMALLSLKERLRTDNWYSDAFGRIGYIHLPAWKKKESPLLPVGFSEFTPYDNQ